MPKRKKKKEPEKTFSTEIPSQEGATAVSIDAAGVARVNDESPEETYETVQVMWWDGPSKSLVKE
ncbi:hypothetical protein MP638_001720, partial [Amoeboaphelidium occidentale]